MVDEWNKIYAYPRLKYSGFAEAIGYIAGQFGDSIPVVRGDGGPYWEDGIASTARSAALERTTEQRALGAEGVLHPQQPGQSAPSSGCHGHETTLE